MPRPRAPQASAGEAANEKTPVLPGFASRGDCARLQGIAGTGFEPDSILPVKIVCEDSRGAESGAVGAQSGEETVATAAVVAGMAAGQYGDGQPTPEGPAEVESEGTPKRTRYSWNSTSGRGASAVAGSSAAGPDDVGNCLSAAVAGALARDPRPAYNRAGNEVSCQTVNVSTVNGTPVCLGKNRNTVDTHLTAHGVGRGSVPMGEPLTLAPHDPELLRVGTQWPDLAAVIEAWPRLPEAIKAGILAMVHVAK